MDRLNEIISVTLVTDIDCRAILACMTYHVLPPLPICLIGARHFALPVASLWKSEMLQK